MVKAYTQIVAILPLQDITANVARKFSAFPSQNNIERARPHFEFFMDSGFGSLSLDHLYKWSLIVDVVKSISRAMNRQLSILDVGAGTGTLAKRLTEFGIVHAIDLTFQNDWWSDLHEFPDGANGFDYSKSKYKAYNVSFWKLPSSLRQNATI